MDRLYEVYDNEQVQLLTRKQAYATSVTIAAAVVASVVLIVLIQEGVLSAAVVIPLGISVWVLAAWRVIRQRHRTNNVAWCVKISVDDVTGYDYARRRTTLPWREVRRIELAPNGLIMHGDDRHRIEIPHLFTDFPALSHRLFDRAQGYGIPVTIEGEVWEHLDVYEIFPFLAHAEESSGPDTQSGPRSDH